MHFPYRALITATAMLSWPIFSLAQEIEIKGLRLGMPRAEVTEKVGQLPLRNFTIAGVASKYSRVPVSFHEDKLDMLTFFFDADRFSDVLEAVQSKYPNLKCETSAASNAMGASFAQTQCSLKDSLGALRLSRFVSDTKTSALILQSDRSLKEFMDKKKERQKDL